ncbi:30S ribosomal protein S5 [Candidatus Falkowbacteria bacterium]|nr:30S ribosomal protein S5 [Candidatus Falkowbacteria bacterium]
MMMNKSGQGKRRDRGDRGFDKEKEFEQKILEIARVTRVTAGGKRMKFRACVIVGDKKGRVGMSVAKGTDVTAAVAKASIKAEKNLVSVPIKNETIPHAIREKFGAAVILMKPAPKGTGVKAGGAMRNVLELAGVPNVVGKILGSKNKINNSRATINALSKLKLELRK